MSSLRKTATTPDGTVRISAGAICFDLDGTLMDVESAWRSAFATVWQLLVEERPQLSALGDPRTVYGGPVRAHMHDAHVEAGNGEWDDEFVLQGFARLLRDHGGPDRALAERAASEYIRIAPRLTEPFAEVGTVLEHFAERVPLAVITNGLVRDQEQKLDHEQLAGHFSVHVISEAVGLLKPDPRIFEVALRELGVAPHEAVYVGDSYGHDVVGARDAGMHAVWLRRQADAASSVASEHAEQPAPSGEPTMTTPTDVTASGHAADRGDASAGYVEIATLTDLRAVIRLDGDT